MRTTRFHVFRSLHSSTADTRYCHCTAICRITRYHCSSLRCGKNFTNSHVDTLSTSYGGRCLIVTNKTFSKCKTEMNSHRIFVGFTEQGHRGMFFSGFFFCSSEAARCKWSSGFNTFLSFYSRLRRPLLSCAQFYELDALCSQMFSALFTNLNKIGVHWRKNACKNVQMREKLNRVNKADLTSV